MDTVSQRDELHELKTVVWASCDLLGLAMEKAARLYGEEAQTYKRLDEALAKLMRARELMT